jgi:phosphoribosyl 1,2-cyclic phosphodiesterase
MKCEFLGTRANIDPRNKLHQFHSALRIFYYQTSLVVDCGEGWLGQIKDWDLDGILITHAHPNHAFGLLKGAPCPVYATKKTWEVMDKFPIENLIVIAEDTPFKVPENGKLGITCEAFPISHSTRAPAVGFRLSAGRVTIFYTPDVAWINDRDAALDGVRVYIGDGASVTKSLVRKPGEEIIGNASIQFQLTWCQKTGVNTAFFTHLRTEIVSENEPTILQEIRTMAAARDIGQVDLARDGMQFIMR